MAKATKKTTAKETVKKSSGATKTKQAETKSAPKKETRKEKEVKKAEVEIPQPAAQAPAEEKVVKKRAGRKPKKVEPQGTVIGTPRLAGLRRAPGVSVEVAKPVVASKKKVEVKKLTKKELQDIKQRLLAMREANMTNLRKKLQDDKDRVSLAAADVIDQASDACDEDMSLEIASTKDEQLQLINTALENIENGTYGQCIMCGETIPATRLRLLPFVIRCKDCKDLYEKTRRRHDANWSLVNGGGSTGDDSEGSEESGEE